MTGQVPPPYSVWALAHGGQPSCCHISRWAAETGSPNLGVNSCVLNAGNSFFKVGETEHKYKRDEVPGPPRWDLHVEPKAVMRTMRVTFDDNEHDSHSEHTLRVDYVSCFHA